MTKHDYTSLLEELGELVAYIRETNDTLSSMHRTLPSACDALSMVSKATETAANNLLTIVEDLVDENDAAKSALDVLRATSFDADAEAKSAMTTLARAQERRTERLVQMMTELSFQDLTCQTVDRIATTMLEVERRIMDLLADGDVSVRRDATATAGVDRLVEAQKGVGRQAMVDEILGRR